MTHEELRIAALKFAKSTKYNYESNRYDGLRLSTIVSEIVTYASDIPDVIGWDGGRSCLIECKASKADFMADQLKPQRQNGTGMGNQRFYFTEKGLLTLINLPAGWGLIEFDGKNSSVAIPAHAREIDSSGHLDEKIILLSLIRRIKMREFLIIQKEGL